jgi:hypothetical protein
MHSPAIRILTALAAIAFAGCSSPATTGAPGAGTPGAGTNPPPAATQAGEATGPLLAAEACSYLSAEEVGAIVGTVPVLVEERAGRGDCDYFLTAAEDAKVNIGLFDWADGGESTFEGAKGFGDNVAIDLGDEAFGVYNEGTGTLVMVRAGDSLISVQAFNTGDLAAQLEQATRLAEAVYNKL